ncbi:MAG: GTP pyrophosphokinase family protein [Lachnospiraceae bacterium]|nr:GTP pyrophosphokinase family protein [Lachnospiraceae bacterium]
MEAEGIYGEHLPEMEKIIDEMKTRIDLLREHIRQKRGMDPVEHCLSRIKSEDSMREKCRRKGLPETADSVLFQIHDAIGFRIVCAFVSDVYMIRDYLADSDELEVIEEKDYIRNAKPNGYRSYHMILQTRGYYIEVQLRTISMDTWAALEHHLKYKKQISGNEDLIVKELKRCADELASTDVSMQTLRDMILDH